jgi:selenocysteine lyase/cysteine desulfurase
MIYLNQAATTYPKPKQVLDAVADAITRLPQGQFRSSLPTEDVFAECKNKLAKLFGVDKPQNIIFTAGATAGANALFYGLEFDNKRVMISQTEHNSVLRPALNLKDKISEGIVVPCDNIGRVDPGVLDKMLGEYEGKIDAFFVNHCSNVSGYIQDIKELANVCHKHGVLIAADFSQSAGCVEIKAGEWGIDAFIFAGHKGLLGIQGIGGYYIRPGIESRPFMYGGTGRDSRKIVYDNDYEYEVGTENGPGIAGLNAGVGFILDKGVENIRDYEMRLMDRLYNGLTEIKGVNLIEVPEEHRGPVLSFTMDGIKPSDLAYILQNGYDITVRTGLHCAPLIHDALKTTSAGTVRISVSCMNSSEDVDTLISAVKDIAAGV